MTGPGTERGRTAPALRAEQVRAVHRDLTYADRSARNRLDLYLPARGGALPPLVVWIHGGGFASGDKAGPNGDGPWGANALLGAGFAVAALNYRLSDEAIWPAQLDDMLSAFAFLRQNGRSYGYDPSRIAAFGPSAGGHLAAVAAVVLSAAPGTRLSACVLWFPPVDFASLDDDLVRAGMPPADPRKDAEGSSTSRLIGATVRDRPDLARAASPLTYLADLPEDIAVSPVLIMHGALDPIIGRGQSGRLFQALLGRPRVDRIEYVLLPEGGHGGGQFQHPTTRGRVVAFLREAFGEE